MSVFGTYEWAVKNINIVSGCSHNCKYCHSKEMAIRFKRKTPESWKIEEELKTDRKLKIGKVSGRVMFPSSHDITPQNLILSLKTIKKILEHDNDILIVSKPHLDCISRLCNEFQEYKKNILFRFSIGSSNNTVLKSWELDAPLFEERIECLKLAFEQGYKTSISCEPMLDNNISDVIDRVTPYVTDSIWIGKMNFLLRRLKMNGYDDNETLKKANELLNWQRDSEIIKLYTEYKNHPKVKWKESIKKVVDIEVSQQKGLDI